MHTPDEFAISEASTVRAIVDRLAFGVLVAEGSDGIPVAAHLPFVREDGPSPHGRLRTHCARANPIVQRLAANGRALVVFQGPDGYVSPSWYGDPAAHVPTWNYVAVHARVRANAIDDPSQTRAVLAATLARHEPGSGGRWTMATARPLVDELLGDIVAFDLVVEAWEGKAKLSQNRSADDRERVRAALTRRAGPDDLAMLEWWDATGSPRDERAR